MNKVHSLLFGPPCIYEIYKCSSIKNIKPILVRIFTQWSVVKIKLTKLRTEKYSPVIVCYVHGCVSCNFGTLGKLEEVRVCWINFVFFYGRTMFAAVMCDARDSRRSVSLQQSCLSGFQTITNSLTPFCLRYGGAFHASARKHALCCNIIHPWYCSRDIFRLKWRIIFFDCFAIAVNLRWKGLGERLSEGLKTKELDDVCRV